MQGWAAVGPYNEQCEVCGLVRTEHNDRELGHHWQLAGDTLTDTEWNARIRAIGREAKGSYLVALPPPAERKRIRVEAGWTQEDLADSLYISRATVAKFERTGGYRGHYRLAGREPVGELRERYAELLLVLSD